MKDFNSFASGEDAPNDLASLVKKLATEFDGKNQTELLTAIYKEAKKGKKQGTLTNAQIDAFANMLSPFLDDKKRAVLYKVVEDLKRI